LLEALVKRKVSLTTTIRDGIIFTFISLVTTVMIDSFFWNYTLWPEGSVFWFNTYQNKSVHWGTSPYYWYFTNAIPRALVASIQLIPIGLYYDSRLRELCLPVFFLSSSVFFVRPQRDTIHILRISNFKCDSSSWLREIV